VPSRLFHNFYLYFHVSKGRNESPYKVGGKNSREPSLQGCPTRDVGGYGRAPEQKGAGERVLRPVFVPEGRSLKRALIAWETRKEKRKERPPAERSACPPLRPHLNEARKGISAAEPSKKEERGKRIPKPYSYSPYLPFLSPRCE